MFLIQPLFSIRSSLSDAVPSVGWPICSPHRCGDRLTPRDIS